MSVFPGLEVSPNSRFRILQTPELEPGKCCLCGAADSDRQYVDFGFQLDWYGAVYFCTHCFVEAAETVGFIPTQKLISNSERLGQLLEMNQTLIDEYRSFRDAVRAILRDCKCSIPLDGGELLLVDTASEIESRSGNDDGSQGKQSNNGKAGRSK